MFYFNNDEYRRFRKELRELVKTWPKRVKIVTEGEYALYESMEKDMRWYTTIKRLNKEKIAKAREDRRHDRKAYGNKNAN